MSIQRWLIIAALLAIAGCATPDGPSYSCAFISNAQFASSGYEYCPGTGADPSAAGIYPQVDPGPSGQ